jgi:hypothetical protein
MKRYWLWTITKTKLFSWEKVLVHKQYENIGEMINILENFDSIYIRAMVKNKWGSFSLDELIKLGEKKQVIDWIKEQCINC